MNVAKNELRVHTIGMSAMFHCSCGTKLNADIYRGTAIDVTVKVEPCPYCLKLEYEKGREQGKKDFGYEIRFH